MKISLDNVNNGSNSGPNSFGRKLTSKFQEMGHELVPRSDADISLCFIQAWNQDIDIPRVLRLDGIYFNTAQDWKGLNKEIKKTYDNSEGIIFQSEFNRMLITKYLGEHNTSTVIHNGADLEAIEKRPALANSKYDNIWTCASEWRPHKRLEENIRYFQEHRGENDALFVAGHPGKRELIPGVFYAGVLTQNQLYSLYKASKYFIHLAWLDHCPNVVVDARASGCQIICSDSGGTKEIAGKNAIVIKENEEWDFEPTKLYEPPPLDFSKKVSIGEDSEISMVEVAKRYEEFMASFL